MLAVLTIAQENALPGTPQSVWDVGTGSTNIEGYATQMSVNHGQTVQFKINTDSNNYRIDIYRTGYYGGDGARFITTINPNASLAHNQPAPVEDPKTGIVDAGNWNVSAQWAVPSDATSGVYVADLIRQDGVAGESQIIFIVRADESHSNIVFKTADATWEAYNDWGGNSVYEGDGVEGSTDGRAYGVSYNRPFDHNLRSYNLVSFYYGTDFPMVRFLEENGYDVSYIATKDLDENGSLLLNHRIFMSSGHDEYWSNAERSAVETARDAGVSLGFFGGNDMFWKTYWTTSTFDSTTPDRTMVTYKETHANAIIDPVNPNIWTGTWRDPRFSPPADGGRPENAVMGTMFTVNSDGTSRSKTLTVTDAGLRFWRNTNIATLSPNQSATLSDYVLGEESDSDVDNGFRPAGLMDLSSTTFNTTSLLQDYGSTYAPGTSTHSLTLYRAASGALVFSAGTQQWSWGLDDDHDGRATMVDSRMQQAMINLFADMGVQPTTLMAGLVPATMSTDHTAPTSTITSPVSGATLQAGVPITIQGTAVDGGGGVVAGVEVSVDGGATWHPASGRSSWTYSWTPLTGGTTTIMTRAVDDSGNLEQPSAGVTINPPSQGGSAGTTFSVWNGGGAPATVDSGDAQGVELGVKFTSDSSGFITGVRFYKSAANTGTHTGSLWSSSGQLLATATFTSESTSGWQQVNFATPVAVTAGATYVASYHTTSGHYSVSRSYFTSQVSSGPLHILADGGVYLYGNGGFPATSYQSSNYWVDVVLSLPVSTDITPPTITNIAPLGTSVAINAAVSVAFSEPLDPATVTSTTVQLHNGATNAVIPATVSYTSGTTTVTLTPTSNLANSTLYTVIVQGGTGGVADVSENLLATTNTASFTSAAEGDTTPPTVTATTPSGGATNVAIAAAATVAFSEAMSSASITASTVLLQNASNVAVSATVTYNAATNTATITPTAALANSATYKIVVKSGASGVKDVAGNALTTDFSASFTTAAAADTTPPTVTAFSPTAGSTNVAITGAATVTFSEALNAATVTSSTVFLRDASNTVVPATVTYNAAANSVTITPTAALANSTTYTIVVKSGASGVKDVAGNALAVDATASFTTAVAVSQPVASSLWSASATPAIVDSGDAQALDVGTQFTSDVNGTITGLRFYKAAGNTGTHTGSLWTAGGQLLATATFTNETASGWQQVNFATPVAITAGTMYVASYHMTAGHYSVSRSYFTSTFTNGPLHAMANGGVYRYGTGGFPTSSYQSSNYWVDVVLNSSAPVDTTPPTVTATTPASGATNVVTTSAATVTFSEAMNAASITTSTVFLRNASNVTVAATVSYNATTNTATVTPTAALVNSATYTLVVNSGASGVKDVAGNALATDVTRSFSTVAADVTPPTVTAITPANGATNVATTSAATVTFSEPMSTASITASTVFLRNASNVTVAATVSYNAATNMATITPTAALASSTAYTVVVKSGASGVKDVAGNALVADVTQSFATMAVAKTPVSLWTTAAAPSIVDSGDTQGVELGTQFTSDTSGTITGIKFYKSAANTGTHTASLWTASGQLLATGTFVNETASGWQQVIFSTPVAITAGVTYIASYHTNSGHYSVSRSYFSTAYTSGGLHVPVNGGVYLYGKGGFPTSSYQGSNYWVDPLFISS